MTLTESHLVDAKRPELQENQYPRRHILAPPEGVTQYEVLQREHRKYHGAHGDAGDEDRSQAKASNGAWEDDKLQDPAYAPERRCPQTDRQRTQVESAKLYWRR